MPVSALKELPALIYLMLFHIKFDEMNKNDMEYSRTLSINWVKELNMDLKIIHKLDWANY